VAALAVPGRLARPVPIVGRPGDRREFGLSWPVSSITSRCNAQHNRRSARRDNMRIMLSISDSGLIGYGAQPLICQAFHIVRDNKSDRRSKPLPWQHLKSAILAGAGPQDTCRSRPDRRTSADDIFNNSGATCTFLIICCMAVISSRLVTALTLSSSMNVNRAHYFLFLLRSKHIHCLPSAGSVQLDIR